jgi:hypothetical protein
VGLGRIGVQQLLLMSALGHSRLGDSAPVPTNVRYAPNSDHFPLQLDVRIKRSGYEITSDKALYRNQVLQLKTAPETPLPIRCSLIFSV